MVDSPLRIGTQLLTNLCVHVPPKAGKQLVERLPVFGLRPLEQRLKFVDVQGSHSLPSGEWVKGSGQRN